MIRRCVVPGCPHEGQHGLSIRARRPDPNRTAVWAPELHAALCDEHVSGGMEVEIRLRPTDDGRITTRVIAVAETVVDRSTPIRHEP